MFFNSKGKQAYDKAKASMEKIYNRLNSNVPDYNPFELPKNKMFVKYPKEALEDGRVYQRNLYNKKDLLIFELNYTECGKIKEHTHYGFYEFIYIKYGTFIDSKDIPYIKGDVVMIDGYLPHSLKCLTTNGGLVLGFSKTKSKLNIKKFYKYIK